jgi:23S rRNA pseudouridine1911/1915/1917 synthase
MLNCEEIVVETEVSSTTIIYDFLVGRSLLYPSRKAIKKSIQKKKVLINNQPAIWSTRVRKGDKIQIHPQDSIVTRLFPLKIEVLFEDDFLAVVNKPAGVISSGNYYKTLVNCLPTNLSPSRLSDALTDFQPVHRLDRSTSGLVIIAKTITARSELSKYLEIGKIEKNYRTFIHGRLVCSGKLTFPLEDKQCVTVFKSIATMHHPKFGWISSLELSPITGRTHQLRKHLSGIGCPIVGDKQYVNRIETVMDKGLFLQAFELTFEHPFTNKLIHIQIPEPQKFRTFRNRCEC